MKVVEPFSFHYTSWYVRTPVTPDQIGDLYRILENLTTVLWCKIIIGTARKGGNQNGGEVHQLFTNTFRQEFNPSPKKANQETSLPPSKSTDQIQINLRITSDTYCIR
jgi:hypothetical protein